MSTCSRRARSRAVGTRARLPSVTAAADAPTPTTASTATSDHTSPRLVAKRETAPESARATALTGLVSRRAEAWSRTNRSMRAGVTVSPTTRAAARART